MRAAELALVSVLLLASASAPAPESGCAPDAPAPAPVPREPPSSGDWEVGSDELYSSRTIQLDGNLTILSGGNLTLSSVRLILNPSEDGARRIVVRAGGSLRVFDGDSNPDSVEDATVISSGTTYAYAFLVEPGASLVLKNSVVKNCGWEMGARGESSGLYTRSSDCIIEDCRFLDNYCGLAVDNCAPRVARCIFYSNRLDGLYARDSSLALEGSTFEQNGRNGLELYGCRSNLTGNVFRNNQFDGLLASSCTLSSEGNLFQLNKHQGLEVDKSPTVSKGDGFYENEVAALFNDSSFEVEGGYFESNRYGMYLRDAAGFLRNTTLTRSGKLDIQLDRFSDSSELQSFNSTFTSVGFGDAASLLLVKWTLRLSVVWESTGGPVEGALVRVFCGGVNTLNLTSDSRGDLPPLVLTQYEWTRAGKRELNPYRFGTFSGRFFNSTYITVRRDLTERLVLDDVPPIFTLTSPRDNTTTTKSYVNVTGSMISDIYAALTVNGAPVDIDQETGNFSTRVGLAEGESVINVTAMDNIGNTYSVLRRVRRDSTPPNLTVELPAEGLLTNSSMLNVRGLTDPGTYLKVCGRIVAVEESGRFDALVELPEGRSTVSVYAMDAYGNFVWVNRSVVVDTAPPKLELLSPPPGLVTNHRAVPIEGRTEEDAALFLNGNPIGSASGAFSTQASLVEGPNLITIQARDPAGNWNSTTILVTLDTVPPEAFILFPPDHMAVNYTPVNLTGRAEPGAAAESEAGLVLMDPSGNFSLLCYLEPGPNTIQVEVRDAAGNLRHLSVTIVWDTEVVLKLLRPLSPSTTEGGAVSVEGLTEPGSTVTVGGEPVDVAPDGSFRARARLRVGPNTILVNVTDPAGNAVSIPLLVERTAPGPGPDPTAPVLIVAALAALAASGALVWRRRVSRARSARPRAAVPPEYLERPVIIAPVEPAERVRCADCGAPVEEYWVTCHSCGRPLDPDETAARSVQALSKLASGGGRERELAESLARIHEGIGWLRRDGRDVSGYLRELTVAAQMLARGEGLERVQELADGLAREVIVTAEGIREARTRELERVESELRTRLRALLDEVEPALARLRASGAETRGVERLVSSARLQLRAGNLERAYRSAVEAKRNLDEQRGGG
ncbi:MAG: right-handed parallel beta-helix repeat-containing protein [Thermoplasmatota archaeon]